jgi:enoyl-CoA hydratase/carnithine racemase
MDGYSTLTVRREGRVLRVDFNNPPLNLMTIQMAGELFDLAGKLVFDPEAAVVIFGSTNPEFFIAHFDLVDMYRSMDDPATPQSRYPDINVIQALTTMWEGLPQVTISAVDGICRGVGLEFILATHIRFATPESKFCAPEASGGFLPTGGGTTRMALQIGPARAREVLLSARDFTGDEAAAYGIVNRTLPREELNAYVSDLADSISLRTPGTLAAVRDVFAKVYADAVEAQFRGFAVEAEAMPRLLATPAAREHLAGMAATQDLEHERDLPGTIRASLRSAGIQ